MRVRTICLQSVLTKEGAKQMKTQQTLMAFTVIVLTFVDNISQVELCFVSFLDI